MKSLAVDVALTPTIRLVSQLGSGGMGTVWAAHHATLDCEVAVKILCPSRFAWEEVAREIKAASRVKSPHVVHMIDGGVSADGRPYVVMELLEGRDLGAHLAARGTLSVRELLVIVRQIAHALAKAHEKGVVHRDLKPSNVFVCDGSAEPFVKLLDFGIAKMLSQGTASTSHPGTGTPSAMSPEQLVGGTRVDHRTDIWALGALVFRALTGVAPYRGETLGALALAVHCGPCPSMTAANPALPHAVDAWFMRACALQPADRFDDALEAVRELETALAAPSPGAQEPVPHVLSRSPDAASDMTLGWDDVATRAPPLRRRPASYPLTAAAIGLLLTVPWLVHRVPAARSVETIGGTPAPRGAPLEQPASPVLTTPASVDNQADLPRPDPPSLSMSRSPGPIPKRRAGGPFVPTVVPSATPLEDVFPHERR